MSPEEHRAALLRAAATRDWIAAEAATRAFTRVQLARALRALFARLRRRLERHRIAQRHRA